MRQIEIAKLVENALTLGLYSEDQVALERLKRSITLFGVLEPLVVSECPTSPGFFDVVSGNRRKQAAQSIGLTHVPCLVIEPIEIDEPLIRAYQEQRVKKLSELLKESVLLYEKYSASLKQGVKANSPEVKEARQVRKDLEDQAGGKHVVQRVRKYHELAQKFAQGDQSVYDGCLVSLDKAKGVLGAIKSLERSIAEKENLAKVEEITDIVLDDVKVLLKSSDNPTELAEESVQLLITSPPYFGIRDYGLGEEELGHEETVKEFVDRLVAHLTVYKPLLKKDGTMWVNLGDYIQQYSYQLTPERFVMGMLESGWLIHDKLIWLKKNPAFNNAERAVVAHEYIYVFKKSPFVKYCLAWVKSYPEIHGIMSYGTQNGRMKLRSILDFRDGVLTTSTANNAAVRKAARDEGFNFTHSATFPLSVPLAAILTSTDVGDLVVDPFNGTATSGRAAQILQRKYCGFELNPTYVKMSDIRLQMSMSVDVDVPEAA